MILTAIIAFISVIITSVLYTLFFISYSGRLNFKARTINLISFGVFVSGITAGLMVSRLFKMIAALS